MGEAWQRRAIADVCRLAKHTRRL